MTLFRKVFQNQSRPATEEEKLDDAALRKAFLESEEMDGPLNLDPFKPRDRAGDPESWAEDAEPECEDDADVRAFAEEDATEDREDEMLDPQAPDDVVEVSERDGSSDGCDPEIVPEEAVDQSTQNEELDVTEIAAVTAKDPEDVPLEASGACSPDTQTDEDIVAGLGRALAELSAPAPDHVPSDPLDEAKADIVAEAEYKDEDEEAEEDPEVYGENDSQSEPGSWDTDHSVMRFAQTQLSAVSQSGAAPEMPKAAAEPPLDLSAGPVLDGVPAPTAGRAGRRAGRVKTRLLGFNRTGDAEHDPFGQAPEATATAQSEKYPVGWLVIVEGPGVGHSFSLFTGASMIGRGEDQVIRLDFGDNSISRNNHAAIAYDEEQNKFYIGHGGKSNIIRRNARPVLSTEELHHADLIRIGETTLRFVALCGSDFQWKTAGGTHDVGI